MSEPVTTTPRSWAGTREVEAEALVDAAAALLAAFNLIGFLSGHNDSTSLSDPFAGAYEALLGAAFGPIPKREGLGNEKIDDAHDQHPLVVEIEARSYTFLARQLDAFGLHGAAADALADERKIRDAGTVALPAILQAANCPPYLPGAHSETLGFVVSPLSEVGLDNPYARFGRMLAVVQNAGGGFVSGQALERLEELERQVVELRDRKRGGEARADSAEAEES